MPEVEVYIGRLYRQPGRGRETVSFQYDDRWIAAADHFPIDVSLKVGRGVFVPPAGREMLHRPGMRWQKQLVHGRQK